MTLMDLYNEMEGCAYYFGGNTGEIIQMVANGFYFTAKSGRLPDKMQFHIAKSDLEHVDKEDKRNKKYKDLIKHIDQFVEENY